MTGAALSGSPSVASSPCAREVSVPWCCFDCSEVVMPSAGRFLLRMVRAGQHLCRGASRQDADSSPVPGWWNRTGVNGHVIGGHRPAPRLQACWAAGLSRVLYCTYSRLLAPAVRRTPLTAGIEV
nr:hypothetical protein CFP56_11873 [Quercus suber]